MHKNKKKLLGLKLLSLNTLKKNNYTKRINDKRLRYFTSNTTMPKKEVSNEIPFHRL